MVTHYFGVTALSTVSQLARLVGTLVTSEQVYISQVYIQGVFFTGPKFLGARFKQLAKSVSSTLLSTLVTSGEINI